MLAHLLLLLKYPLLHKQLYDAKFPMHYPLEHPFEHAKYLLLVSPPKHKKDSRSMFFRIFLTYTEF